MIGHRIVPTLLTFFVLFTLTGCWDRVEIDKRGFVVGVALDKATQRKSPEKSKVPGSKMSGTFQFIIPAGLKSSSGSTGHESNAGKSYFNIGVEESSMAALTAMVSSRTSRSPYYEHLKLIIISQEIARDNEKMADTLDFFLRGTEMRRDMHVLIADGKASEILNVRPLNENYPISYIESTIANTKKTNYILRSSRLGNIHEHLLRKNSFTIQLVRASKGGIMLTGAALFDGIKHRMIGELNGETTQGLNFLTNQIRGGIIETDYNGKAVVVELERADRKIKLTSGSDKQLKFTFTIDGEGMIVKSAQGIDLLDPAEFINLEARFEQEIVRVTEKTIHTLQQTYKKDAMGLGNYLYRNHYRTWKKVASDWEQGENLFAKAKIEVKVHLKIRRTGDINEAERS